MIYHFEGAVYHYGKIVDDHYDAETTAVSIPKAINNLSARWKKEHGYEPYLKIELVGIGTVVPDEVKTPLPPKIDDLQESIDFG